MPSRSKTSTSPSMKAAPSVSSEKMARANPLCYVSLRASSFLLLVEFECWERSRLVRAHARPVFETRFSGRKYLTYQEKLPGPNFPDNAANNKNIKLYADATAAKMREMPLDDFYNSNVRILSNGCVPHAMSLWEVKPAAEAKHRWDLFNLIGSVRSPDAFPPAGLFGCPLSPA